MKPSRIRVLLIGDSERLRGELADFLSTDALMDIAGCRRAGEAWPAAGAPDADVAVLELTDSAAVNRENLRRLKNAGVQIIAISRACADAAQYRTLVSGMVSVPAGGPPLSSNELYTQLKYQIRNARLARAVKKGGFKGTWRVFPADGPRQRASVSSDALRGTDIRLIAIGASAGGTQALMELIPALPPDMPAVALVQHMPEAFVALFAAHLQEKSRMRICLAEGGERAERGTVYLTALDKHLTIASRGGETYIVCEEGGEDAIRPSVDRLFSSAAALGPGAIGVILTGMGADGARGLLEMRRAGAYTIGQDEKSCVVYGMPRSAYRLGAVMRQLPLEQIAPALQRRVFSHEGSPEDAE